MYVQEFIIIAINQINRFYIYFKNQSLQFLILNFKKKHNRELPCTSKVDSNYTNINDVINKFGETFKRNKYSSIASLSSIKKELTEVFKME